MLRRLSVMLMLLVTMTSAIADEPSNSQPKEQASNAEQAAPMPPQWRLQNQKGEWFSNETFSGKPMIISIWGTWCHYCKRLHPELQRIHEKFADEGLEVIGISVNEQPETDPAAELLSRGITFPTLVKGDEVAVNVFDAFGTPLTIFVRPDGTILGRTMLSDPEDPRFEKTAALLVSMVE